MNNLVISVARNTQVFIGLETTPGVQLLPTAPSMNSILLSGAGSISQMFRRLDDPQYRNTLSKTDPIPASFDTGKWTFPALIKTVAQSGTPPVPELDPILTALFGAPSTTAQTAWFGANTRAYLLKKVDLLGTVFPAFTFWLKVDQILYYCSGGTCNTGELNVAGNELCKGTFSGEFMHHGFAGTDDVSYLDSGSGTSLIVEDAQKYYLSDPALGDQLPICIVDPSTGAVTATAIVTAIDYDTNTLTLFSGVSRYPGNLVCPSVPANTEIGTALVGKFGITRIGGVPSTKIQANLPTTPKIIQTARITVTNNIKYFPDLKDGKNYPTQYCAPSKRECSGEIGTLVYRDLPDFLYKALRDPLYQDYLIVPMQDSNATTGRIAEFHCPRVEWDTPNQTGEDEKTATIAFKSTASPSYDDEAAFVFAAAPSSTVTSSTTSTSTT